jgi:hemolysin III
VIAADADRCRGQTIGEEIANSVAHGLGFFAALAALPFLILGAAPRGAAAIVGASLFGGTMALLYLTSTLYHALPHNRAKRVFQVLDHAAIYLLIAGTYTPFTLGILRGPWGWSLFGLIWALAAAGVVLKAIGGLQHAGLSTGLYIAMGWLILVAVWPLWLRMPGVGMAWLVAGGVMYTVGVAFYAAARMRYSHFVWHLFVLAGSGCHFIAVLWYAA